MAAPIGGIYVSLTADVAPYARAMSRAQSVTSKAGAAMRRDVGLTERSVQSFGRSSSQFRASTIIAASRSFDLASDRVSVLRGALLSTTAVFGGFLAAMSSNVVLRYADTFTSLHNQMRVVTKDSADLTARFDAVADVADRSRASLQGTAVLYSRLQKAAPTAAPEKMLRRVETIQKALTLGGATGQEAYSTAIQLSQGIASNRLGGEELRAILETPLGLELAKGLGVTIGKFREMGHAGQLTADVVLGALDRISGSIDQQFNRSIITVEQSLGLLDNALIDYFGNLDKAYGATRTMAGGITGLANNLETILPIAGYVGTALAALFVARGISSGGGRFFGGLKENAKAAKDQVLELRGENQRLKADLVSSAKAANAARRGAEGDLSLSAGPQESRAYKRATDQVRRLDEQKIASTDRLKRAYGELADVSAQLSPRAAKLAQEQINAENALTNKMKERRTLMRQLERAKTYELVGLANQSQQKKRYAPLGDAVRARKDVERQISSIDKQALAARETVARKEAAIAGLVTASEQKAVQQRVEILRTINQEQANLVATDQQRNTALTRSRAALAAAEASGAAAVRASVNETGAAYRANAEALKVNSAALASATRAATLFGQAQSFARNAASGLLGVFGGGWGLALTAGLTAFTYFAAKAQEEATKVASAQSLINDQLERMNRAGANTPQAEKSKQTLIDAQIENKRAELRTVVEEVARNEATLSDIFSRADRKSGSGYAAIINQVKDLSDRYREGRIPLEEFDAGIERLKSTVKSSAFDTLISSVRQSTIDLRKAQDASVGFNQELSALQASAAKGVDVQINVREVQDKGDAALRDIDKTGDVLKDLRSERAVSRLKAEGKTAEARATEIANREAEKGNYISKASILPMLREIEANEKRAASLKKAGSEAKKAQREIERTADIIDKIKREGEGAGLSDLDREVISRTKNIKDAEVAVRQYIAAIRSGDLSKAPKGMLEVREALQEIASAEAYRNIVQTYGTGAQLTQEFADKQGQLARLVQSGQITADQAAMAWADYVSGFGQFEYIDQIADTFGGLASGLADAAGGFGSMEDALESFKRSMWNLAINEFLVQPIKDLIRTSMSAGAGSGGGFGGFLSSLFSGWGSAGAPMNLGSFTSVPTKHGGGRVDGSGHRRRVPTSTFAGAPRYHSGLMSGEYATILKRGEQVLTREHSRRSASLISGLAGRPQSSGRPVLKNYIQNNAPGVGVQTRQRADGSMETIIDQVDRRQANQIATGRGVMGRANRSTGGQPKLRG